MSALDNSPPDCERSLWKFPKQKSEIDTNQPDISLSYLPQRTLEFYAPTQFPELSETTFDKLK